ncbi:hypothetical protein HPODL_02588 [Ogataea parapolymorpha DL-1]|uniref:Uncharacterized protein n=1 Tax=Ogataea parapolymorpha (strain ATCC 26012 / BCRC 20466 / JCM 22074 / NRRL Y-7560 / DL-1) TaxID=871575 RepID=W1Q6X7_OGAPD|nr:hypothetical protein HPODL_02588 [Ogataea parapolymorpha DL-1]ESW95944.1 hypothetical protein HPODL_02588 [Ogataea parapolymorpha DL-1]
MEKHEQQPFDDDEPDEWDKRIIKTGCAAYNLDENYKMSRRSLFKTKPENSEGPLITPSKVRRFKAALARKSDESGNTRLKRLLWLNKQKKV